MIIFSYDMWLSLIASVLALGVTFWAIYKVYLTIHHPDVVYSDQSSVLDFVNNTFNGLLQADTSPNFEVKPKCSAGIMYLCNRRLI